MYLFISNMHQVSYQGSIKGSGINKVNLIQSHFPLSVSGSAQTCSLSLSFFLSLFLSFLSFFFFFRSLSPSVLPSSSSPTLGTCRLAFPHQEPDRRHIRHGSGMLPVQVSLSLSPFTGDGQGCVCVCVCVCVGA